MMSGETAVQRNVGKPRLLDLFCGAGGAAKGYQRVGFYVVGVDINPQPNYCGDRFIQADALETLATYGASTFHAIHASPPCQRYSSMTCCRPGLAHQYHDLVAPVRAALAATRKPYVIENVVGAPLIDPVTLCGRMFGRDLYRHRLFECHGFEVRQLDHPEHLIPASKAGHWKPGTVMSVAGHFAPVAHGRLIMDIDWMNREEMAEAIPPYYAEFIGRHLLAATDRAEVVA